MDWPAHPVDPRYVSFALDWWPPDKGCEPYGWGSHANVLDVDLKSPQLIAFTKALGPSILRIGGTLEKVVEYDIPEEGLHCIPESKSPCLNTSRWRDLHDFAVKTNCKIVFGLSYPQSQDGRWNATQATALLRYSQRHNLSRATTLHAVELGEEMSRFAVGTRDFDLYTAAYHECANLLKSIWEDEPAAKPLLVGPSPGMRWPRLATWFPAFLNATTGALEAAVYHSYNQIEPGKLYLNFTIPSGNLSTQQGSSPGDTGWQAEAMNNFVRSHNNRHKDSPNLFLWLDEFGPHNHGGGTGNISASFASSFGYLDTLGSLARLNHSMLARQTLVGGRYELLRCSTGHAGRCSFEPYPDYWVALLWQKLMGTTVLDAPTAKRLSSRGTNHSWIEPFRFHAHCTADRDGAVTVAFSNTSPEWVSLDAQELGPTRIEYVLQGYLKANAHGSGFNTSVVKLNGSVLRVGKDSTHLPPLKGRTSSNLPDSPFMIPPISLGFLVFAQAMAPACSSHVAQEA
ncbi:Heparanase-like protein [Seminavis robusta]|uniref:Heparanase-like protein n=1 Tax=Seminavis robusta TaxID=568900 RepID=A0A9N8E0A9_9STRA|nr:Heparanase-like protein [Seminavis robusta]|eukprot:Sro408_g136980.1 Heparanase-like protein (513) ;mRNA; r:39555-41093